MTTRRRWAWLFRPEAMLALIVVTALLLALGIVFRSRGDGAAGDRLRIAPGASAATTAAPTASAAAVTASAPTVTATALAPPTTPTPTPTPGSTVTATPSPTATAADLPALAAPAAAAGDVAATPESASPATAVVITLSPNRVGVGETMLVSVRSFGADNGSLTFRGESLPLSLDGDDLWAVVGVPVQATLGAATLAVTTRDPAGNVIATATANYEVVPVDRPIQNLTLTEEEASVLTAEAGQREYELRLQQFSRFDRGRRWNGRFARPLAGPITTLFGSGRRINGGPPGSFHSGTDIANALGTPVLSAAAGRVSWTGEMPIRGNTVIIDHGAGVLTHYSHLSAIHVAVDQSVRPGETIGLVGSTGLSTGPHLHWELSIYGVNVDPFEWITTSFLPGAAGP